jgi:hypothetical protein
MAEYRKGHKVNPTTGLTEPEERAGLTREETEADAVAERLLPSPPDHSNAIETAEHVPGVMEVKGHTGTVRFDGETVTILRKGGLGRLAVGKGEKHIPLASISAVQFKPAGPVVNGYIQFTVGGGIERRSAFGRQTAEAGRDENSVVFHYQQRQKFEELRDTIQEALTAHHRGRGVAAAPQATIPQQIEQLAALRESGAITDAEYEAKKTELLSRM